MLKAIFEKRKKPQKEAKYNGTCLVNRSLNILIKVN